MIINDFFLEYCREHRDQRDQRNSHIVKQPQPSQAQARKPEVRNLHTIPNMLYVYLEFFFFFTDRYI